MRLFLFSDRFIYLSAGRRHIININSISFFIVIDAGTKNLFHTDK